MMQRHVLASAIALVAWVTACSTILGLEHVDRIACVEDCGVLGSGDGGPNTGPDGGPLMEMCVAGECEGGYCDLEAGVCRAGCASNADCTDPMNPLCDVGQAVCVPCLPGSNTCPGGTSCSMLNGAYTCTQGCATSADCTQVVGDGGAATVACCNSVCTNTAVDDNNCNGCGMVCPGAGDAGGTCCNSTCTNDLTSASACGGCGQVCSNNNITTPTCAAGICNAGCNAGFADCNGNKLSDGCETDTNTDPAHCGGCTTACGGATPTCDQGACAYAIGGALSGLPSGDSIVLLDNGGNALTLAANGAYKFTTPIVTGHAYDVTIMTAPASETCTVAGGTGTVAGADVTTANVTCMSCYVAGSKAFAYTGAEQSWTAPCGVTSVSITADGAAGAVNGDGNVPGALGGAATITLAVSAGEVLEVFVGGAGSGTTGGYNGGGAGGVGLTTTNGGGGGGASDVRTSPYALANRAVVAAGGGGAGGDRIDAIGPGAGGGGGGGYFGGGGGASYGGGGGGPGTPSAGGAAGTVGCSGGGVGTAGVSGAGGAGAAQAGNGQAATQVGGAGGAGGGTTGAAGATGGPCETNYSGGGGGGGSSYAPGGTTSTGVHAGDGAVTLSW